MSFTKDNEAYLRSKGYSGTRYDSPRDSGLVEKNKHLYDSIVKAAGDDGQLTQAEYETIYNDRGPWGKYAYNQDSVTDALARAAADTGFKIDQNTLDRHDLAYDGDDIMAKIAAGDFAPSMQDKDKYSYERTIEDDDDAWNVFRYKAQEQEEEKKEDEKPIDSEPEESCPSGQVRGTSGACIEDKEYADNPWEEPKKTPKELADRRDDWDKNWDPSRFVSDLADLGSIPYHTPHMSSQYKPSVGTGKFAGFLRANKYKQDRSN
tara:strand:+ start:74 stop:862 length:789 start_codon:yes stop_codon:yes gene_type:complete